MVERRGAAQDVPSPEEIAAQLERLLQDQRFRHSESLSRFLRYTVQETLEGRAGELKEQVLGLEVFHRGEDFDPRIDTIVRVQAGKLRTRLDQYYQGEGAADAVVISLPKGGYVPVFNRRSPTAPPPVAPRTRIRVWLAGAAILLSLLLAAGWWLLRRDRPMVSLSSPSRLTADIGVNIFPTVSRDGKLVVYSSDRGGRDLDLWLLPPSGGNPVQLTRDPGADITPDISPDGSWVVYRSNREQGGLYLASVHGNEQRRLTDGGWRPRFSPDGSTIAFQAAGDRPGGELFVIPVTGGSPRRVDVGGQIQLGGVPIWTPDGSHLIFSGAGPAGITDWWAVPRQGGEVVCTGLAAQLRSQGLGELNVETVPGDWIGNDLLFALVGDGSASLWKVPIAPKSWKVAGPARQVTSGSALELGPRASVTGRIVFSSDNQLTHLWSLSLSKPDAPLEQLTTDSSLRPGHFRGPAVFTVSPRFLAFSSHRNGNADIWIKEIASGKEWAITSGPENEEDPLLSPDDNSVAYVVRKGTQRSIYVLELNRRLAREICAGCGRIYAWHPDGRRLLAGAAAAGGTSLQIVDAATGARSDWVRDNETSVHFAALSPDGRRLALAARSHGSPELRLSVAPMENDRPADRTRWTTLPDVEAAASLSWSATGDRIYFFSEADGRRCLWGCRWDGFKLHGPQAVRHFHDNRRYPWNTWLSAGHDHLVFALTESSSNIWSIEMRAGAPSRSGPPS